MNVLVIGGGGAIGYWSARSLIASGHKPVLYDVSFNSGLSRSGEPMVQVLGDAADLQRLLDVTATYQIDRIVHLAMIIDAENSPVMASRVAVQGLSAALETARARGIARVVFASAKAAYGAAFGDHRAPVYLPAGEDTPRTPVGVYGAAKLLCEEIGRAYQAKHGVGFVAFRFASTYGLGKDSGRHGSLSLGSAMVENAVRGLPAHFPKGGDQRQDWVYYKDIAQAVVKACEAGPLTHQVFNIGSGIAASFSEFADGVRAAVPGADVAIGPGLNPFETSYDAYWVLDIGRARDELGYRPAYGTLALGIADYVREYRALLGEGAR